MEIIDQKEKYKEEKRNERESNVGCGVASESCDDFLCFFQDQTKLG